MHVILTNEVERNNSGSDNRKFLIRHHLYIFISQHAINLNVKDTVSIILIDDRYQLSRVFIIGVLFFIVNLSP